MTAIHELGRFHALVAHKEMFESLLVDGANRFFEIPVGLRIFNVDIFRLEISQNPWKNGVLGKIAERSVTGLIEVHKIFVVGNLFSLPHHCYVFELINFNALA
jgi:hypothetical protein